MAGKKIPVPVMRKRPLPEAVLIALSLSIPFAACGIQWILWQWISPYVWFLFYPAVFVSARIGGLKGGIGAAILSSALVVFFFMPPQLQFKLDNESSLLSIAIFIAMGVFFGVLHESLKKANRKAAEALSESQTANAEITRLYEKTKELDELKTRFFANVSHELRTPLQLILGPSERRLHDKTASPDDKKTLEGIVRNARILNRHVNDLLDIAKLESGGMPLKLEDADLSRLCRLVVSQFESLSEEKGIRFSAVIPAFLPVRADIEKIRRILVNLLSNAFKFTPDGGRIGLTVEAVPELVRIFVTDDGPGIPEDQREAVFERFRQVDGGSNRRHGGTGLGLAIVREFTELHGGSVRADRSEWGGSQFTVSLPLKHPESVVARVDNPELNAREDDALAELHQGELHYPIDGGKADASAPLVLVVEDNTEMNGFISETLGAHYRVAAAFDGKEGLELAKELSPALIVTDLMMPGMSGDQMVKLLREEKNFADTPVVVLTARADDTTRLSLLRDFVQDYLYKPFSEEELLARCGRLIQDRQTAQERLRNSQKRFHSLMEQAPDSFLAHSLDGRLTEINDRACRDLGYSRIELLSMSILDIVQGLSPSDALKMWSAMKPGEIKALSTEFLRKDGSVFPVEMNLVRYEQEGVSYITALARDVSFRVDVERERELSIRFLRLVNTTADLHTLLRETVKLLRDWSLCESVGIRIREGQDYPYFETTGFDADFLYTENTLCKRDSDGNPIYGKGGEPFLECMCGNILQDRTDPGKSFFTVNGSFWSNNTTRLLAETSDEDRQTKTRNRCNGEGYESVALIPLRDAGTVFGLIQLNSRIPNRFTASKLVLYERLADNLALGLAARRAEQQLRDSEFRFRSLFSSMHNGFAYCEMIYDGDVPQDFRYLMVNPAFEEQTGLRNAAGKKVSELIPGIREADPGLFEIYGRVAKSGNPEKFEFFLNSLSEWFEISVYSPEPGRFVSVFDVVTARKNAEMEIRNANERYELAASAASLGVWDWDLVSNHLEWDERMYRLYGLQKTDFAGAYKAWRATLHPDDLDAVAAETAQALSGEKDYDTEFRIIRPDGEIRILHANGIVLRDAEGKPLRMTGVNVDVTERRTAEESLRKLHERYKLAVKAAALGIWERDLATETLALNARQFQIFGLDPETYDGKASTWLSRLHPEDREQVKASLTRTISEGTGSFEMNYRFIRPDGGMRYIHTFGLPVKDAAGKVVRLTGANLDVTEQTLAEQALQESEKRYRELFENMLNAVAHCRMVYRDGKPVDFIYLSINPSFEEITGIPVTPGSRIGDIIPGYAQANPESLEMFDSVIRTGQPKRWEHYFAFNDRWFSFYIYTPGPGEFIAIYDNISERKKAENALRESERRYRELFENMLSTFAHCRMIYENGKPVDYEFITVNPAFEKSSGLHVEPGDRMSDLVPGYARENQDSLDNFDSVIRSGKPIHWDHYLAAISRWFSIFVYTPGPEEFVLITENITERKNAEAALRESEAKFSTVFHSSPLGIAISDVENGAYLDANDTALGMTGYSREDVIGKTPLEIGLVDDPHYREAMEAQILKEGGYRNTEMRIRKKNGQFAYLLINGRAVLIGGNTVLVTVMADITDRITAEEQIRLLNTTLEEKVRKAVDEIQRKDAMLFQQARLSSIGEVMTSIAHQWRQPLNAIALSVQLIKVKFDEQTLSSAYLEKNQKKVLDLIDKMSGTIDYFSHYLLTRQARNDFSVLEAVQTALEMCRPFIEELEIDVKFDHPPSDGDKADAARFALLGNRNDLVQLFLNLLNNCRDAFMHRKTPRPAIRIGFEPLDSWFRITVADNGGGVPDSVVPRIFEPYVTTKFEAQGVGLSLYICRSIVEKQFGGRIQFRNESDGAVFDIFLCKNADPDEPRACLSE